MLSDAKALEKFANHELDTAKTFRKQLQKVSDAIHNALNKLGLDLGKSAAKDIKYAQETVDAWVDGMTTAISNAQKRKAQREQQTQQKQEASMRYMIVDNGKYSYVKADRQVFTSSNIQNRAAALENYLNSKIDHTGYLEIPTTDGDAIRITNNEDTIRRNTVGKLTSFDEYIDENGRWDKSRILLKQNIALHIDEIIAVSRPTGERRTDSGYKHDGFAQKGWSYRTAYFQDYDGSYYEVKISIAENDSGKVAYNVNKFRERNEAFSGEIMGSSFSGARSRESFNDGIVSDSSENVNRKMSLNDFTSSVDRQEEAERAKAYAAKAEKHFGITGRYRLAGYLTINGRMLDFSEGQGYRVVDHREISDILDLPEDSGYSDGLIEFMRQGNIRMQEYGIDVATKPNDKQRAVLTRFFNSLNGEVTVDFSRENGDTAGSIDYPEGTNANKILSDIDHFVDTGEVRELSEMQRFHFSLNDSFRTDQAIRKVLGKAVEQVHEEYADIDFSNIGEDTYSKFRKVIPQLRKFVNGEVTEASAEKLNNALVSVMDDVLKVESKQNLELQGRKDVEKMWRSSGRARNVFHNVVENCHF